MRENEQLRLVKSTILSGKLPEINTRGEMLPQSGGPQSFIDTQLGLAFHSDSAFLRGMMSRMSAGTAAKVDGVVIPARSDNDTGNNPLNQSRPSALHRPPPC
jgi:hypothetical protein